MDTPRRLLDIQHGLGLCALLRFGRRWAIVRIAAGLGLEAMLAGRVEEGPRQVILEPVGVQLRPGTGSSCPWANTKPKVQAMCSE